MGTTSMNIDILTQLVVSRKYKQQKKKDRIAYALDA